MAEAEPNARRVLVGLAVVAVALSAGGGLFLMLRARATSEVTGELTVDGSRFAPQRCRSGKLGDDPPPNHLRFDGVDLFAPDGRTVRVIDDPMAGASVLVIDPGAAPRPVDRAACERFDVQLRDTGELIMEVWGMEGSIALACPDVRGEVRFERCFGGR